MFSKSNQINVLTSLSVLLILVFFCRLGEAKPKNIFLNECIKKIASVPDVIRKQKICSQVQEKIFLDQEPVQVLHNASIRLVNLPGDDTLSLLSFYDLNRFPSYFYCYFQYRKWFDPEVLGPAQMSYSVDGGAVIKKELDGFDVWLKSKEGLRCQARVKSQTGFSQVNLSKELGKHEALIAVNPISFLSENISIEQMMEYTRQVFNHERIHVLQKSCPEMDRFAKAQWKALEDKDKLALIQKYPAYKWSDVEVASRESLAFLHEQDPLSLLEATPGCFRAQDVTTLILDMGVRADVVKKLYSINLSEQSKNFSQIYDHETQCEKPLKGLENYFTNALKGEALDLPVQDLKSQQNALYAAHGYHILGLIHEGTKRSKVIHFGLHNPSSQLVKDVPAYIKLVQSEFDAIHKILASSKVDFVNYSQSESVDEIEQDFIEVGVKGDEARNRANQVYQTWLTEWRRLTYDFPHVAFIVSAGNGGTDWIGDDLQPVESKMNGQSVPASLSSSNVLAVGSVKEGSSCPSLFSNYGSQVVLYAQGENIESWSGCSAKKRFRLTGSSQATALVTNYLMKELEKGIFPEISLKKIKTTYCDSKQSQIRVLR